MKNEFIPALRLTLFCALFFSGIYTLAIFGIAHWCPNHGDGEIVMAGGKRQHVNVAQKFTRNEYFWPRPSAVDYNAAGSGGSNKGTTNPEYLAVVKGRIDTFLLKNPTLKRAELPADLVTASGSGIDPDISVQGAMVQVARIASARHIDGNSVQNLISGEKEDGFLHTLGPEKVNVLRLNIALDKLKK